MLGNLNTYQTTPPDADNQPIDQSLPVGTMAGTHGVSATGAATYTTPLFTSPGTAGMQPSLSLSYNSQGGNGIMGMGWNLNAVSVITRTASTIYHDGFVDGIDFDESDRLMLDGQRLVDIDGTTTSNYLANNNELDTENASYMQVKLVDVDGVNGPDQFIVKTKDGKTLYYGNTTDSRIEAQGKADALLWLLSKVEDQFGNYMTYHYIEENTTSSYRLVSINYTGNTTSGMMPYNKVEFMYNERQDKNTVYIHGSAVAFNFLLKKVKMTTEGQDAHEYRIDYWYDEPNNISKLIKITEYGSDGTHYNPTVFEWGAKADNLIEVENMGGESNQEDIYGLDLNGDGVTDLLEAHRVVETVFGNIFQDNVNIKFNDSYQYTLNNTYNNHSYNFSYLGSNPLDPNCIAIGDNNLPQNQYSLGSFDFKGDQKDEIFLSKFIGSKIEQISIQALGDAGSPFIYNGLLGATYYGSSLGDFNNVHPTKNCIFFGDFNGDTYMDFISILSNGTGSKALVNMPGINEINKEILNIGDPITTNPVFQGTVLLQLFDKIVPIDFNGDGKKDLMLMKDGSNTKIVELVRIDDHFEFKEIASVGYPTSWHDCNIGDFNGDGKEDILTKTGSIWSYGISNGINFIEQSIDVPSSALFHELHLMDIDNNGLIEVVKLNQLGATNLTINKFINNAFVKSTHNFTVNRSTFKPVIGDFNGDGNSDFLLRLQGMSYEAMFFNRDAKNKKIVKIADGFSNILDFEYGNNEKRYENTVALGAHVFPCIKFQKNSLLTKVNYNNKILSNYWYNSGFYNRFGKGFIGFGVTTTSNVKYNLRSSIYILNSTADGNPLKIKQANYKYNALTGNTYLNETTSNFDYHFYANKRALAKLINDNSIDFETTFTSNNVYSYDIMNGNLTTKNTTIGDKTIIENYVYTYAPYSSWVKSLLTQQSSTVTKPGTSFNTSIKNYYNTNGSLNHIIKNQGTAFEVATYFETYDVYGNVKMSKMQAASLPNKTSNITYDSRGRFATSSKNNAGWITKYQTEPIYGGVIKTIDYNNRIVEHQYNGYGSNTKTIDALGNVKTNKVEWISVGGPPNTLFKKETSVNNKNYTYAYFTKDARQLRSQSQAFDGSLVNQDNIYNDDNSKTIWKASLPYFNGSTPKWITSTYDDYYRPVNETDPNGLMMKYVYEGAKTSITNPNGTQKEINVNEEGQTSKILENGATLKYIYHANSKPYIITNCGSATTFQYDLNGNKTLINDPNAGPTIYKTDAYGRLTYQKDANGNTSNFTFDNLDRLIQKQVSNPSSSDVIDYNYVYDSDLYNKGALNTESSNDETINYTYLASTGFLSEKTHTLSNGEQFTYQYKYNEEGDLINKTYPDLDFGIDFQYNALGSMNKMLNANDHSLIWQCDAKNETGSITQSTYGNGLIYTKTYDNVYNYLTKQQAATAIDMAYEWEPTTANLTSRKDNINALTEHFEYDSSDRLTSAKIDANPAYFNITYTNNGNIQQKSDIGVYNYDPTNKPNAVKHIDYATAPLPYPIPSFSQAVGYNILGKVNKIEENNNQVSLTYGCANQRALATYMHDGIIIKRKTYFPNYEKTIVGLDIKKELYISTPDGLASIYQKNIDGTSQMYYTYTDHLGSLTALTDATGTVLERLSYDAWGRRRSATDWAYEAPATSHLFDRGYTMHEHLDSFNIINMNGRIYDPLIGRMMQPDNYVQDATNTQSYNRYSYCWNNPMKYTDPSGDLVQLVIGGVIGGVSGYMIGKAKGATGWGMAGYIFGGVAIGAISGGVGSAVTSAVGSAATVSYGGLIAVGTGGATAGAISGAGFAALGGGNVGEGLWKGAVSGLSGGLVGGYITGGAGAFIGGATAGGVGSALNGGDINDIGKSALIGGGISLGSYQLQSAINYYDYKESGGTFTREQFKTVSRSAQKSFTRGKEYGGWLTSDGGVEMFPRGQQAQVKPQAKPNGATGFFHTHPNTGENWVEIHSPADVNFNNNYARVSSLVVGRQNTYMQLPGQNASLLSTNKIFNPYPFSYYWFR